MTGVIIVAVVMAIILLIFNLPVTAYVRYYGGQLDLKVKYAFLTLYPKKERKRKAEETDNAPPEKPPEETEEKREEDLLQEIQEADDNISDTSGKSEEEPKTKKSADKADKRPLMDRINEKLDELNKKKNAVQLALELVGKPLKKLFGKIRIGGLVIDFDIAHEDAHEAAVLYGKVGAAVYNVIGIMKSCGRLNVRSVTIDCLYNTPSEKCRYDCEVKISLRPASVVNALSAIIIRYITGMKKYSAILDAFLPKKPKPDKKAVGNPA